MGELTFQGMGRSSSPDSGARVLPMFPVCVLPMYPVCTHHERKSPRFRGLIVIYHPRLGCASRCMHVSPNGLKRILLALLRIKQVPA